MKRLGRSGPPKERKIKRYNQGGASDPFLDTPYVPLTINPTPTPPSLTAERVERGPIVRPEYPTTSMAVTDIKGIPIGQNDSGALRTDMVSQSLSRIVG